MPACGSLSKTDVIGAIVVIAFLAVAPLIGSRYIVGIMTVALCYAIWATSWDFMSGLTGRENFGHSLFIGTGAYTAGFLNVSFGLSPWWGFPAAAMVAVLFSLVIGIPTLRLRGPYFALAMLSGAVVMQKLSIIFSETTGGQDGLNGLSPMMRSQVSAYYFTLAALVGFGGALYANYQLQVGPDLFDVALSINIIIMVYVGGMGSIYGAVGGALLLIGLTEGLRSFSEYRLWVYTLILILILFFIPNGVIAPAWVRVREWIRGRSAMFTRRASA